jgi:hypothetical protein
MEIPYPFDDLESLRWKGDETIPAEKIELPRIRERRDRRFFPALPERLFARLVRLPDKCLTVYLVLLQRSRMEKANPVVLTTTYLSQYGISRGTKARSLADLERGGLVRVEKRGRKNPLVWLLEEPHSQKSTKNSMSKWQSQLVDC